MAAEMAEKLVSQLTLRAEEEPEEVGFFYILIQCCGSGIRCLFDPWIRDPRWVKNQDPDSGPDRIFESLETICRVKILEQIRNPGWADPGSGINIPDTKHCFNFFCNMLLDLKIYGTRYRGSIFVTGKNTLYIK